MPPKAGKFAKRTPKTPAPAKHKGLAGTVAMAGTATAGPSEQPEDSVPHVTSANASSHPDYDAARQRVDAWKKNKRKPSPPLTKEMLLALIGVIPRYGYLSTEISKRATF